MMLAPILAVLFQAAAPVQPPPGNAVQPALPGDWSTLPPLPYRVQPTVSATMNAFAAGEVSGQRCALPRPADGHYTIRVDLAVLVAADASILKATPRAIQCPTIEQYSAGLLSSFARNNLLPRPGRAAQWYRTTITYDWRG